MRMYLSSFDTGESPHELVALAPNGRVGVIMNALDNRQDARDKWQNDQEQKLQRLGFSTTAFDLRHYFGRAPELARQLAGYDVVWINGGNAFILRRAMSLSGFDVAIKDAVAGDSIVYAGFSAAAVVLSKSLQGLELVDDPDDVPDGYPKEVVWDGLGLLPYSVVVHHGSAHSESEGAQKEVSYYRQRNIAYRTISDGQALVISSRGETIVP